MWSGVLGAPCLWLALLQMNYVLAYPTCAWRSNAALYVASTVVLVAMLAIAVAVRYIWRTGELETARRFLAVVAMLMTALSILLVLGTALPPFVLHPCD